MRHSILVILFVTLNLWPVALGQTQFESLPRSIASDILESMTPEERVGQLFIVTFKGSELQEDSPILDLIATHHISGVLLRQANDNYVDAPETLNQIFGLISDLQDVEYNSSQEATIQDPETGEYRNPVYVPLFMATNHEGGGPPFSEIYSGLTELPTEMAIGATWSSDLAQGVGEVLGNELASLGYNLLFGPSLDVLEEPRLAGQGDLGVRSFGGDPFWVSELSKAYIDGLHAGSNGRLGVIAKHFPGLGSADRSIEVEVATVRKSLEQLKQIELAPFFAVTGAPPGENSEITDGLLTSHIRYQGFQGNIRATTRPISLDPQAYSQLMALEPLAVWREGGGITISDSLGSRAVRRFQDPLEWTFKGHLVARDAFLAGNDLLLLSNFKSPDDPDEATTIRTTLAFFANKYREDTAFAQRVDEAVLRILRLKLRLYQNIFSRSRVAPNEANFTKISQGTEVTSQVARAAASLISPSQEENEERLGGPPKLGERVVFFTDVRLVQQCSTCSLDTGMNLRALEETILSLYGPAAAGQVGSWNLQSFSMADLSNYLGDPSPPSPALPLTSPEQLEEALLSAKWLVFSILDISKDVYGSNALKLFLDLRPDLARAKNVVVFSHDVPYGLDATDISKLDSYYALYSKGNAFIDVAAHLLFLELPVPGAPPVTVPGSGYNLIVATSPDPGQVISLFIYAEEGQVEGESASEEKPPEFIIGDLLHVETGVILDVNANPVPDGTVVEFILTQQVEGIPALTLEATTSEGVARISVPLERPGLLSITARSDPARISETLELNVQEGMPAYPTLISPTRIPTMTPVPTDTPIVPTPTVATEIEGDGSQNGEAAVGFPNLMLGLLGVTAVAGLGYVASGRQASPLGTRVRFTLIAIIGGLIGYNYLALGFPGSDYLLRSLGMFTGFCLTLIAGVIGLLLARLWWQITESP